jgi:hypothetical protein
MSNFIIEIASAIDREKLVAEIWLNDNLIAEINQENQTLELEIYFEQKKINFELDNFILALQKAKDKLILNDK